MQKSPAIFLVTSVGMRLSWRGKGESVQRQEYGLRQVPWLCLHIRRFSASLAATTRSTWSITSLAKRVRQFHPVPSCYGWSGRAKRGICWIVAALLLKGPVSRVPADQWLLRKWYVNLPHFFYTYCSVFRDLFLFHSFLAFRLLA